MFSLVTALRAVSLVKAALPIVSFVKETFGYEDEPAPVEKLPPRKYDSTPFTQEHYDAITERYMAVCDWNAANPSKRITGAELTIKLNEELGLNKSRTSYARIWNGHVDRAFLPRGEE